MTDVAMASRARLSLHQALTWKRRVMRVTSTIRWPWPKVLASSENRRRRASSHKPTDAAAPQDALSVEQFFTAEINERSHARARLSSELRRALERDEFRLFYQPKIDLRDGRTCGAEALLRWQHPDRGVTPPAQFIPVLEETGLIVAVGEWVVKRACEDVKAWCARGWRQIPVAVNVSARQVRQPDFDVRIRSLIDAAGITPDAAAATH